MPRRPLHFYGKVPLIRQTGPVAHVEAAVTAEVEGNLTTAFEAASFTGALVIWRLIIQ